MEGWQSKTKLNQIELAANYKLHLPQFIYVHVLHEVRLKIENKVLADFHMHFSLPSEKAWQEFLEQMKAEKKSLRKMEKAEKAGGGSSGVEGHQRERDANKPVNYRMFG